MNIVLRVIIDLFIVGGCFFAFAGAVGVVRMPDTFSRMQTLDEHHHAGRAADAHRRAAVLSSS